MKHYEIELDFIESVQYIENPIYLYSRVKLNINIIKYICIMAYDNSKTKRKKCKLCRTDMFIICCVFICGMCFILLHLKPNDNPSNTERIPNDNPSNTERIPDTHQHLRNSLNHVDYKIDIGIVAACVPQRLSHFFNNFKIGSKWMNKLRFIVIDYECENTTEYPMKVSGVILEIYKTNRIYSRSSNINEIAKYVNPNNILLIVDVDMYVKELALENIQKYVVPNQVYFPIVWSKYSPKSIKIISETLQTNVWPFTSYEGIWRTWGYGMFAMHYDNLKHFKMDEKFTGWGGEDNDLHKRVKNALNITIIRKNERGLVHKWHPKICQKEVLNMKEKRACLGSKATYNASPLGWMLMHDKRIEHDKIVIIVPICLKYFKRVETIISTWGKSLPEHIKLIFFASETISSQIKNRYPGQKFIFGDVEDNEYPPVKRNTEMLQMVLEQETFGWLMKVDDDTYVNIDNLQTLTYSFRSSTNAFLGARGNGRPKDKPFLELKKPMCLGGTGYLIRRQTLSKVVPNLDNCVKDATKNASTTKYLWHSDVTISKCIQKYTQLGCWESDAKSLISYNADIFKNHYKGGIPKYFTVTYHPLKTESEMVEYHKKIKQVK